MTAQNVFISYKSEYRDFALRVRDALQSWGHRAWIDVDHISPGDLWTEKIQNGLEIANVVVAVVTPEALKSREVLDEWLYARRHKKRLLLLCHQSANLDYWLANYQYVDFRNDEVLAFNQLQDTLNSPDASIIQGEAPDYLLRHVETPSPPKFDKALAVSQAKNLRNRDPEQANHQQLLVNVYEAWIEGVLEKNLEGGAFDLGVGLKADAVLRHVDYGDYAIPESSRDISQIFHDMNGQLLILGKPGSGKTMLMLQMAKQLLAEAQQDLKKPIPVILNLSSWAAKKLPLQEWLVESLRLAYGVPKKTGEMWIKNERLTLMLDGLDEVAEEVRDESVTAINTYQSAYPRGDMVVCSRIADYEILQSKLNLNGAILLEDLSETQIEEYLKGKAWQGTRALLANESEARDLARSPFLLNTMKITYVDMSYDGSPHIRLKLAAPEETRHDHLFGRYVENRLANRESLAYSSAQILYWLSWLAKHMVCHRSTVFYIEDLQSSFLSSFVHKILYRMLGGALAGLIIGLYVNFIFRLNAGLISGLLIGIIVGAKDIIIFAEKISYSIHRIGRRQLVSGLFGGIFGGIFIVLWVAPTGGLLFGLFVALLGAPLIGLLFGLLFGLKTNTDISARSIPNQGFKSSLLNSVKLCLFIVLFIWLSAALPIGIFVAVRSGLLLGLFVVLLLGLLIIFLLGLPVGLFTGIFFGGGRSVIQHFSLRFILATNDFIPRWRYDRFLDTCADLGFLRKVGGGYIFRHRLLMEYFAEQYEKAHPEAKPS